MKTLKLLRSLPVCSLVLALAAGPAQAAIYYWDSNGTTPGLGDIGSLTWGSSANVVALSGAMPRSVLLGNVAGANTATTTSDLIYFGTFNLGLGSSASTVPVGTRSIGNIVFGAGQANAVTLSGGTITLAAAGSVTANNTSDTISSVLGGAATSFTKDGPGTLNLTGANIYTGTTIVSGGGTLNIGNGTSGSLGSTPSTFTGALTFHSGAGVFHVRAADAGSTQAMGALTFANTGATAGEGTIQSTYGTSGNAVLSFSSLAARQGGATGNFVVSGGANGTTTKIVLTGAAAGFLDKGLYFGGSSYAAYDAGGYVRGLIYGTDANAAATNTITASSHVQLTNSPAARAGDTLLSLNLAGGGVNYTMDSGSLTVPAILKTGGGAVSTISGGTSLTTAGNAELVIRTDTSSDSLTISSAITGFSGGLAKTGKGTNTLSGNNGYTGVTRILDGTLVLSGGSAIADNQQVLLANAPGAILQLNSSETVADVYGGGFSGGTVNVQGNTLTLSSGNSLTFGGTYTGTSAGGIIKQGAGTLTLGNKNTFAGTCTLEGGAVLFNYGNDGTAPLIALSSGGAFNMANGTTLRFSPTANLAAGTFGTQLQSANGGSPAYPYGWVFANDINITSGIASIRVGGNENSVRFTGNVTGATSGAQTLAIYPGGIATGDGDRQPNVFAGTIQNGSGGTLGVNIDFVGASGSAQNVFASLSGQNTFTGPITVANTKGLTAPNGGYVGIGGEIYSTGGANVTFVTGGGYLGGGNYTNTISLASGTILTYLSSANQTLAGAISGGGSLLKQGAGTLTLTEANTYQGGTIISAGTLKAGVANAIPGNTHAGDVSVTGTFDLNTYNQTINGLNGAGTVDTVAGGSPTLTVGANGNNGSFSGVIKNTAGTLALTKSGPGVQILSGANTYTGATAINGGTLRVVTGSGTRCASPITVANTAGCSFAAQVAAATGQWASSSDLTVAGANSELDIDYTSFAPSATTDPVKVANLNISGGGTLKILGEVTRLTTGTYPLINFTGTGPATDDPYTGLNLSLPGGITGKLTVTANHLNLVITANAAATVKSWNTGNATWDAGTPWTIAGGGAASFSAGDTVYLGDAASASGATISIANAAPVSPAAVVMNSATHNYTVTGSAIATGSVTVNSTAGKTLTLPGGNTYTGLTDVQAGTLAYGAANVIADTASVKVSGGTLSLGGNSDTVAGVQLTAGSITGTGTLTSTSTYDLQAGSVSAVLAGSVGLNKSTAGTVILTGANTYNGGTTITNGTLMLGGSFANTTSLSIGSGATLAINRNGTTIQGAGGALGNVLITGDGSLNMVGTGSLTLNLANTFTGGTTVSAGTMIYGNKKAFGTGPLTLAGGTKLQKITEEANGASLAMTNNITLSGGQVEMNVDFSTAKDQWFSGKISGAGSLRVTAAPGTIGRALTLTGNNDFSGGVTLDTTTTPAWIQLGHTNGLGTGTLTINATGGTNPQGLGANTALTTGSGVTNNIVINAGATLNLGGASGNLRLSGVISGAGSLHKQDANATTFFLDGLNTYTGPTTIRSGTLLVNGSLGTNSVTVTNATLGGTGVINGPVTVNATGTLSAGASIGTLTIGGAANNSGTLRAEIVGGPSADKVLFNGGLTLNSGSVLTVTNTGNLANGETYDLFDGSVSGTFTTLNLPGGLSHWNTNSLYSAGLITLSNNAPVAASFTNGVAVGGSATTEVMGKYASDADGDVLTLTIGSAPANGTATVVSGTNITYVSTNSAASDSFTYTVSDGLASATGTVTVTTYSPQGFNRLSVVTNGFGDHVLTYLGIPGTNYALEITHDLTPPVSWNPLITNAASTNGYLIFTNTPSLAPTNDFYRTRYVP